MAMNDQQQKFVDYYCGEARGNSAEAARLAGYSHPKQLGWRLKNEPEIRRAIDDLLQAETLTQRELMARWTEQAGLSMDAFFVVELGSEPRPATDSMPAIPGRPPRLEIDLMGAKQLGLLKQVKSIRYTRYGPQIEIFDPERAQENLARAHGMFAEPAAKKLDALLNDLFDALPDDYREQVRERLAAAVSEGDA